jgi:hypothetical protein
MGYFPREGEMVIIVSFLMAIVFRILLGILYGKRRLAEPIQVQIEVAEVFTEANGWRPIFGSTSVKPVVKI